MSGLDYFLAGIAVGAFIGWRFTLTEVMQLRRLTKRQERFIEKAESNSLGELVKLRQDYNVLNAAYDALRSKGRAVPATWASAGLEDPEVEA